jgi:hypothetical protein
MDSIQEQIIKKISAALALIAPSSGYENTLTSVQRFRASGVDLTTMPTILVKEGDCIPELDKSSPPHVRRRMELYLVVCVRHDEEADARSGGEILNAYVSDIERCLASTPRWDGLALMTDPPAYLEMEVDAETPHLARGLRVEIVYEHVRADPRTQ